MSNRMYSEHDLTRINRLAEKLFIHQGYMPTACFQSAVNFIEVAESEMKKLQDKPLQPFERRKYE